MIEILLFCVLGNPGTPCPPPPPPPTEKPVGLPAKKILLANAEEDRDDEIPNPHLTFTLVTKPTEKVVKVQQAEDNIQPSHQKYAQPKHNPSAGFNRRGKRNH